MTAPIQKLVALLCPGRGSYGREELGSLGKLVASARTEGLGDSILSALAAVDSERKANKQPGLIELDAAESFRPSQHLDGENAALLIYFCTLLHAEPAMLDHEVLCVGGNSLGWYSALAVTGVLSPRDGSRLVTLMARLQKTIAGGQILTTLLDADWKEDPTLRSAVDDLLAVHSDPTADDHVAVSIMLGGHVVLAGTERGVRDAMNHLPKVSRGDRTFPFRLAGHGPFHTTLCQPTSEQGLAPARALTWNRPETTLIDGHGNQHTRWSGDPEMLLTYTLTDQVVQTFDFSATVRTAIRECNPDELLCCGPGQSLRAPVGHVVLREGWRGLQTKQALFESGVIA